MPTKRYHFSTTTLRYGILPLGLALLVLVLRSFFFLPYRIGSSAMAPTLRAGQWALFARTATVQRGDIILFDSPLGGQALGRIIALPGDSLSIRSGKVFTNGVPQTYTTDQSADYSLRIPREQGVYPLSLPSLVAYRLALRAEVGYRSASSLLPTATERSFWHQYLQEHPYHTFHQDYYWVLCDQPHQGIDSRHFGILPAASIRGVLRLKF